jgi:anion-transporting  ArsA/GET3 family ATPase
VSGEEAIARALRERTVLVCVGAGGVGKTTVAASLALRAASAEARSALVCTIDPARRLANSLGLSELGNEELRISEALLEAADVPSRAPLHAMMLDMKRTWDDLVTRHAPPDKREKILQSRFYQALSTRLAGSQEYIAMEKLCQLRARTDYGLVVLDTPPTAHALDFLDAPNRVLDFLDNDAAKWLLTPALAAGKVGLRVLNLGSTFAARTLSKFTGTETLQELAAFMHSISSLNASFRERARQVRELLAANTTAFVLVTAPGRERLDEAVHFHDLLRQNRMAVAAVVVNRVHSLPTPEAFEEAARLQGPLRPKVEATLHELRALAEHDQAAVEALERACAPTPLVRVPRFERDVHDLPGLWHTGKFLVGERQPE